MDVSAGQARVVKPLGDLGIAGVVAVAVGPADVCWVLGDLELAFGLEDDVGRSAGSIPIRLSCRTVDSVGDGPPVRAGDRIWVPLICPITHFRDVLLGRAVSDGPGRQ